MSIENCKLCKKESTPWTHINGHICEDCYFNSKNDKWISIKDKFPQNMQRVLAYCKDKDFDFLTMVYYANKIFSEYLSECDRFNSRTLSKYVTHWMPLPEPPK